MTLPARPDACIKCGTAFPANRDLTSIPNGRSIVIDRANGHAWRVCGKCAEWELLGPERAGALMKELRDRAPSTLDDPAMHRDQLGQVKLLLMPMEAAAPIRSEAGLQRKKHMAWARPLALLTGASAPLFLLSSLAIAIESGVPGWMVALNAIALVLGAVWLGLAIWLPRDTHGRAERFHPWTLQVIVLAIMAVHVVLIFSSMFLRLSPHFSTTVLYLYMVTGIFSGNRSVDRSIGGSIFTSFGKSVRVTPELVEGLIVASQPEDGKLVLHGIPTYGSLTGRDAIKLIDLLSVSLLSYASPRDAEEGWLLLRRHSSLDGLAQALSALRPDDGGGVRWEDLSTTWKVALSLGAAEMTGPKFGTKKLLKKLEQESGIAAIAGSLASGTDRND